MTSTKARLPGRRLARRCCCGPGRARARHPVHLGLATWTGRWHTNATKSAADRSDETVRRRGKSARRRWKGRECREWGRRSCPGILGQFFSPPRGQLWPESRDTRTLLAEIGHPPATRDFGHSVHVAAHRGFDVVNPLVSFRTPQPGRRSFRRLR